ncbi:Uncharacterised protein [Streptococcus pneumoniae]|jgi:hypothetical protein|nr:Uncharacterised protein [Streptococcus pneumoniae]CRF95896.1 Uncharacterised protein [Streptococcus pneumoniae]
MLKMPGYKRGTDTIYRGTTGVQSQFVGVQSGYKTQKMYTFLKSLYPLKCLASPDHTFFNVCKFPLCSYKEFRANLKFGTFLKEIVLAGTKKVDIFLSHFMQNFSLHVDGQCLKISQLVLLKILYMELKYIYLAHILILRVYVCF